jgi:hypothetical protein
MKHTVITLLTLLCLTAAMGQNSQTVKGKVVDKETKVPLPGATVLILNTPVPLGASTDVNGSFRIEKVNVGRYNIRITYLGYEDVMVNELLVGSGKEVVLNIEMTEEVKNVKEVVVTAKSDKTSAKNEMITLSGRTFSVEETKRYAAAFNDPSRMVISYAGVSAGSDLTNEIVIRGNSPRGMLWRLEGIEIPNPNHFGDEAGSGGGISILSVNVIDNSDFLTGAFPAEYGNATSGVFDISLRKGNNEKREYAFQCGVMGTDIAAEGPFSKKYKGSYLVNYRYSTLGILNAVGIKIIADAIPEFQDLSFKIDLPAGNAGVFSVFGMGGISVSNVNAERDTSKWEKGRGGYQDKYETRMGVVGIKHMLPLKNNKTYMKTVIALSGNQNKYSADTLDYEFDAFSLNNLKLRNTYLRSSFMLNHKKDARNTFRVGAIHNLIFFDLKSQYYAFQEKKYVTELDNSGNTSTSQVYAHWKYRPLESLTFNTGVHMQYVALSSSKTLEPRFGMKWNATRKTAFSAGMGLHSKIESMSNYFTQQKQADGSILYPNKDLEPIKAFHSVIGFDRRLTPNLFFKAEAYYQYLYDVPIENNDSSQFASINYSEGFTNIALENAGKGRNYGLELTMQRVLNNKYYFLVTTSLFQSDYVGGDGVRRNTRYNGNYILNVLGGKEFMLGKEKNKLLGLNIRSILAGGKRFTPINLEKSIEKGYTVRETSRTFESKVKDYYRLDLGINYRNNRKNASHIIAVDIQNVMNHQNVFGEYFNPFSGKIETDYMLGILPSLSYRIEF